MRQECRGASGGDRQAEVGTGQRLGGEITKSMAQLHTEVHAGHRIHHRRHGAHHVAGFFRQRLKLRVVHVLRYGGHHALPHRQGFLEPLGRVPCGHGTRGRGKVGGVIKPQLGQAYRFLDGGAVFVIDLFIAGDLLQGNALG